MLTPLSLHHAETSGAGYRQPGQVRILRGPLLVQVVKIVQVGATILKWFIASNTLLTLKLSSKISLKQYKIQ